MGGGEESAWASPLVSPVSETPRASLLVMACVSEKPYSWIILKELEAVTVKEVNHSEVSPLLFDLFLVW